MPSAVRAIVLFFLLAAAPAVGQSKGSSPFPVAPVTIPAIAFSIPAAIDSRFPHYPIIAANIRFWEKIYGTCSENQGLLHDRDDLDRIYAVIDLLPRVMPGAGKINEKFVELARLHCQGVLKKFAEGGMPQTAEEQRIYALFTTKTPAVFQAAMDNMRVQTGLKERFRAGVVRSGASMPVIKEIMRQHGLPLELAYLPHVESSFNPQAHSKAAAAGLWQFTTSTGRDFMTINDLVDERFDLHIATNAAALFLKENYRQLGCWPLALTAYNHGRAGMVRAQQQWGAYPAVFASYDGRLFGFASKNFYSEFLAALKVARQLESDPSLIKDQPAASIALPLRGYVPAKELREYFALSEQEFSQLNPALRQPVLAGKKYIPKGYVLRLPATPFIQERIRALPDSLFHAEQISEPVAQKTYAVKKGDTAAAIARRFGVSVKTLRRANRLGSAAALAPGQSLIIPSPDKGRAKAGKRKAGRRAAKLKD